MRLNTDTDTLQFKNFILRLKTCSHDPTLHECSKNLDECQHQHLIISLFFTAVINLPAFAGAIVKTICQNNSELECEQDHEYSLKQASFRNIETPVDCLHLFQVSEWFLLWLPGSLRQSSCECLQLHQICPSIIHCETGMNQKHFHEKKKICHGCRQHSPFQSFDFHSQ